MVIAGVSIVSNNGVYNKVTDIDGRYEFAEIAAGQHSFVASKEGYVDVHINVDLQTGVTENLSFEMEKIIP